MPQHNHTQHIKDDIAISISNGKKHQGHLGSMSHDSARGFLRRFWTVTFLLLPLIFTNETLTGLVGMEGLSLNKWIQFIIATIIFGFSLVFFQHAWHEIKMRKYGMMTLVSLAVGAGYIFSVASTFIGNLEVQFYLEISTLIWVLLFGHYLEARSSSSAGNALQEVAKLLPKKAHRLINGKEEDVDIGELKEGDIVLVKPGEKIPADGIVEKMRANVDESLISGESKPVNKMKGDSVVAGSICIDGSLIIKLNRVGENSTIGQIKKLITEAGKTKPRSQRIADKASAILTFVAGVTALVTIVVWTLVMGEPFVFAITLAITVLVIACPHALGLAIPTVTTITTSLAIKNGIFIKNLAKIEVIRKADFIVFDKTGTLTYGEFGVTDVISFSERSEDVVLQNVASIEQHSSHIIGQSIVKNAKEKNLGLGTVAEFQNIAGKGVIASIADVEYIVGNETLIKEKDIKVTERANDKYGELVREGKTVIYLAYDKEVKGIIALADKIKEESYRTVEELHKMGIRVAMLTGDNESVAKGVAKELNIDTYFANVMPLDKYKYIKKLQEGGSVVLMVGDGVNDAPALTQADSGIAIGAGTDVAVDAGDVVLMRNNPIDIVRLIILAKKVYTKMIQNLVWALGYNIVAIPAAAGVFSASFFFGGFFLRPEIGALVMSLSTVIVVANAMTLKRIDLDIA